jgi:general secretion pathway protein A
MSSLEVTTYENFYGLRERAFNLTPDPAFLFLNQRNQEGLEHILYGIERREGFAAIVGDVGTGKTTLCWAILERLEGKNVRTALIQNPTLSEIDLLKSILQDFGVRPKSAAQKDQDGKGGAGPFNACWMIGMGKKELIDRLNHFLAGIAQQDIFAVLIIDESQNLSLEMLEQLRLLSNLETAKKKLLQIIFVGQLGLDEKLNSPGLRQLNQRISVRFETKTLSLDDTERYIRHRLAMAGGAPKLRFGRGAFRSIQHYSRGYPRLINLICDRALLSGYSERTLVITRKLIRKAASSLKGKAETMPSRLPLWLGRVIPFAALTSIVSAAFLFPFWKTSSAPHAVAPPAVTSTASGNTPADRSPVPAASAAIPETPPAAKIETAPEPTPVPPAEKASIIEPAATGVPGSGYVLQIYSFRTDQLARSALPQLVEGGYTPYVSLTDSGWYAVFAGPYEDLAAARDAAATLRDRGISVLIRRP